MEEKNLKMRVAWRFIKILLYLVLIYNSAPRLGFAAVLLLAIIIADIEAALYLLRKSYNTMKNTTEMVDNVNKAITDMNKKVTDFLGVARGGKGGGDGK